MTQLQSQALYAWVNSLPLTDKEAAITYASTLEQNPTDFDSFAFSLGEVVDFNLITPSICFIRLTQIPVDQPFVSTIHQSAFQYLVMLFTVPDAIDESYTQGRLVLDFCGYLLDENINFEWYLQLLQAFGNQEDSTKEIFGLIFLRMSEIILHETINTCNAHLKRFSDLVQPQEIRQILVKSPKFPTILRNLFSQTVLATDSVELFADFFGLNLLTNVTNATLKKLDGALTLYRSDLFDIMRAFLKTATAKETTKTIEILINEMREISRSSFAYSANSGKRLEAFALNFESIILKFLLLMKSKINNINPFYPYLKNSHSPATSENRYTSETTPTTDAEFKSIIEQQNNEEKDELPVTKFFFFAYQCLDICSCGILQFLKMINEKCSWLNRALRSNIEPTQRKPIQDEISILTTNSNLFVAYLLVPSKAEQLKELFSLTLSYLVQLSGVKNMLIPDNPPIQFAYLPDYILSAIAKLLGFYIPYKTIAPELPILTNLMLLFANRKFILSQETKFEIIKLFSNLSMHAKTKYISISVPHIAELMFPAVLQFYCDVQVTNNEDQGNQDKINYRIICCQLLTYWFVFQEFRDYFVANVTSEYVNSFIFYLVDGCMYFTDHSIQTMYDIFNFNQDITFNRRRGENDLHLSNLQVWLRNCTQSLDLMSEIVHFCPQAYFDPLILDKLTKIVLAFFNLFSNNNNYVQAVLSERPSLEPYTLFVSVIKFTYASAGSVAFNDSLLNNEMYNIIDMIPKARLLLLSIRPDGSDSICKDLDKYYAFLQSRKEELDSEKIDYDDAPPEFCDELTDNLMNEPMLLPSGNHLDMETLKTVLLNKLADPFTMCPMTFEDCKLDVELKAKIDEYKQKKREEKKSQKAAT